MSDVPFGRDASATSIRGLDYIHPVTPAARSVAYAFYLSDPTMRTKVDDAFRYVFETPIIETAVRGLLLQRYLIQRLEIASGVALRTRQYYSNHALGDYKNTVIVQRQMRKVEWNGESVPQMTLSRSEDILLVPLSPIYPGVDFLIWAAKSETLCLFQVTLSSVRRHSSNFWQKKKNLERQWTGKLNVKQFKRVWISPNVDAGPVTSKRSHEGQLACTLADILQSNGGALFPLLQSWSPASEVAEPSTSL